MPSPTRIRSEEIARSEIIRAPIAAVHSAAVDQTPSGRPATTITSAGASENEESADREQQAPAAEALTTTLGNHRGQVAAQDHQGTSAGRQQQQHRHERQLERMRAALADFELDPHQHGADDGEPGGGHEPAPSCRRKIAIASALSTKQAPKRRPR